MLSFFIGLIVMIVSLYGLVLWWDYFLIIVRGFLPICFVFGSIVAVIAGFAGWKEKQK